MHTIARRLIFFIIILLCAFKTMAQTATAIPLFYEKVFLHTDRDIYTQGEDVWFKAYLVNAQNNKPINYSHNLYVELISPGLKIITLHVLRLEQGLGNGDFKLADTLSAGTYRLRAYTNWMRNFGDNFIFEKNITVVNTEGKQATAITLNRAIKKIKKKLPVLTKQDTLPAGPLVRFFPEGGSLVNDVSSVVAVKAEDEQGKGIAATGQVLASSNRVVGKFVCDSLGFGSFTLEPDETQQYHATVTIKGKPYDFKINDALTKGFTLGANSVSPFIVADINCNTFSLSESGGTNLVIVGSHAGRMLYKEQIRIQSKNILLQIPDANFPEGIATITLYNEHNQPLNERLVYVHHPAAAKLMVTTDKITYQPRENVIVKIKLSDTSTISHLSLAVVDENIAGIQTENILSYLELKSEIKGTIEHPERYFDTTNLHRYQQLDMLLLTQGWRDFVWKSLDITKFKPTYDVEQALTINGRVRNDWFNKAQPNTNITMFASKATGDRLFTAITDSTGHFRIDGPIFYGYQYINFTSRKSKGINADGTSKGKTGGWIQVDSLFQNRMIVSDPTIGPDITLLSDSLLEREKLRQKFSFTSVNNLKTVEIKKNSNVIPPKVYPITLKEQKEYSCVGDLVVYMIPGAHWEIPGTEDNPGDGRPFIENGWMLPYASIVEPRGTYTDKSKTGRHADDDYWGQPMDRVLKVTIKERMTVDGPRYTVDLILRPGSLEIKDIFDNTVADMVGYTKDRVFYAPHYTEQSDKPDYRTTIHWEPNITTDKKGEATVSYYNADPKTKIRLIVQGVTDSGVPVVASAGYVVK